MKITDTHVHLYDKKLLPNIKNIINISKKNFIYRFFMPSLSSKNLKLMFKIKKKYNNIFSMIGLHPNYLLNYENVNKELLIINNYLKKKRKKFIGIGEIGIDLYKNKNIELQIYALKKQIKLANKYKLPVCLHIRNSFNEFFNINLNIKYGGVIHCFSGNLEQALYCIKKYNLKLGIGGLITFKKNKISNFLKKIDLSNIILETDSPYLIPFPFKGYNNPSYLYYILIKISKIYKENINIISKKIEKNINNIFLI
ncbi:MAG: TatD family hydrolase [Candidatus Shikimatogenerans bostrichidophilus]|nr:MAG: TatD family hydrolase [Candidatus Shikimatogenerans bostrichidophilus]